MSWNALEEFVSTCVETSQARRADWDRLDAAVGDGDFGSTLTRGTTAVEARWGDLDRSTPAAFLREIGALLHREMGGSSGPLLAVACERAADVVGDGEDIGVATAAAMLDAAAKGIAEYGQSQVGDKTVLDALVPAGDAVSKAAADGSDAPQAYAAAALAAAEGARATRDYVAKRGRAVYSADRNIGEPDPAAVAVAEIAAILAVAAGAEAPDLSDLAPSAVHTSDTTAAGAAGGTAKQFVNDPARAAGESLSGLARSRPDLLVWDGDQQIIRRATPQPAGQVGLVSGGGSGHEPLHAGFVGDGMLSTAAPGGVFASPSSDQILAATRAANTGAGVLHVVKNYTGDVLNFRLAGDAAQAEGIEVASVLVDDDVSVDGSDHTVGKRGTGATVFVHKIAGAVAAAGGTLDDVRAAAASVVERSASFAVALTSPSLPGANGPILALGPDEIEIGVGIHGERGRRSSHLRPAKDLVAESVDAVVSHLGLGPRSRVIAMVNGFGATPLMELYVLFNDLADDLAQRGITVDRNLVGNYVTSLDMAGASLTLLISDDETLARWDAPVHTAALRWGC